MKIMKMTTEVSGLAIATAAAMLFMVAPASAAAEASAAKGRCMGANACKEQSSCKTASNSCKGQNSCKGKGFLEMTKADCDKVGGQFEEPKSERKSVQGSY